MFDLPKAKRVKRSKLFSNFSSPSASESEDDEQTQSIRSPLSKEESSSFRSDIHDKHESDSHNQSAVRHESNTKVDYGFEYDFIDVVQPKPSIQQSPAPRTSSARTSKAAINTSSKDKNSSNKPQDADSSDDSSELSDQDESNSVIDQDQSDQTREEQSYEFMLFKPTPTTEPSSSTSPPKIINEASTRQIITIRSPTPETEQVSLLDGIRGAGKFVRPRPPEHYFTWSKSEDLQTQRQTEFAEAAVSGVDLMDLATRIWHGARLPWRVIAVPASAAAKAARTGTTNGLHGTDSQGRQERSQRARPSKKKRILVRRRREGRLLAKRVESEKVALTEAEEREKRTRRNREKKVKRKEKEKLKKVEAAAASAAVAVASAESVGTIVDGV